MPEEVKRKRGNQYLYTEEIADEICARLAGGESLAAICRDREAGFPKKSTVLGWVLEDYQGFADRYARARELGYLTLADEIMDIADDGANDWMVRRGMPVVNKEAVERSKLRVESRFRLLSKMLPKVYGDKVQVENKIGFTEEFEAFIRTLNERKQAKVINGSLAGEGGPVGHLPARVCE